MSAQAVAWVLKHSGSKASTRCVLVAIANNLGGDGEGWCYVDQICAEANVHEDTYKDAVRWAIDAGELERDIREGGPRRMSGRYRPNLFRLPQLQTAEREGGNPPPSTENREGGDPPPSVGGQSPPTEGGQSPPTLHPLGTIKNQRGACEQPSASKTKRGCQLPEGWAPDDRLLAWAAETFPNVDPVEQTAWFTDHHRAKGSTAKDWRSSWRTWIRRANEWGHHRTAPPPSSHADEPRQPLVIADGSLFADGRWLEPVDRARQALDLLATDVRRRFGDDLLVEGALCCIDQNPHVNEPDLALAAEVYAGNARPLEVPA